MTSKQKNSGRTTSVTQIMGILYSEYGIEDVNVCDCGAFTFGNFNGNVSVQPENAHKHLPLIPQEYFDILADKLVSNYRNCNHCANHWGLDLCACGSGEPYDKCSANNYSCGSPSQNVEDFING